MADPDEGAVEPEETADAGTDAVADLEIPAADLAELDRPVPEVPDAVLPESFLAEPVIPPPAEAPVTRAARRAEPAAPPPASDPRLTAPEPDPAVVPPPSGATSGGYRGVTIAIYGFLGVLLVGAVVLISVLLT